MGTDFKNERVLLNKFIFTLLILLVYLIGRNIPLYGIDVEYYANMNGDAQNIVDQFLTGDYRSVSLFILGIWPHMIASVLMMAYTAVESADQSKKASPKKMQQVTYVIMMIIGCVGAFQKVNSFVYVNNGRSLMEMKTVAFVELIAGMLIVTSLCQKNQKFGIGGRSAIVLVNMLTGVVTMISQQSFKDIALTLVISVFLIIVMILLETTEKRIPVQRVSIRNVHAEKSYLAYKFNPAGIMPVIFASSFFMIPQMIIGFLSDVFPTNGSFAWAKQNMTLTKPLGICIYLAIIFVLTIAFALLTSSTWKTANDMMKAGDSLVDIYAGKKTLKYLMGTVIGFSCMSAVILCICVGIPLYLQILGMIPSALAMLPFSIMLLTGLWISLYREYVTFRKLGKYEPFL